MFLSTFRINYNRVIQQANEVNQLSSSLNSEIIRLENLLAQIKNEWCGPASSAFQNQLIMLIADMKTTRFNMSNVSSTIKNVAANIQKQDEHIAAQAQTLGN